MAAIEVERLIATLEARIDKYEKNLAKALGTTDKTFTAIESRGKKMQRSLDATFASFGKGFVFGAAGALGFGALTELPGTIRKVVGEAAGLVDVANKLGLTTDALQALHFAATQGGASVEDMDKALGFFTKSVGQALDGTGELGDVLKKNGIALRDQGGKVRSNADLLRDYADLIKNAGSEQERARLTAVGFGRAGADLANVFRGGAGDIDAAASALEKLGGLMDAEALKQIAEIDDRWDAYATTLDVKVRGAILRIVTALDRLNDKSIPIGDRIADVIRALDYNPANKLPAEVSPDLRKARDEVKRLKDEVSRVLEPLYTAENAMGSSLDASTRGVLDLVSAYASGDKTLDQFAAGLDAIAAANPDFSDLIADLKQLQTELSAAAVQAYRVENAIQAAPLPNRRAGIAGSALRLRQNVAAGQAGLTEASKDAGLSSAEKRLADEMERLRKAIEKDHPGALVTDAQIRAKAQKNLGLSDLNRTIEDYVNDTIKAEGRGKNPNSSADGVGNFITSTWLDLFKRYFPDRAKGMADAAILALRHDEETGRALIEAYARENAAVLQKAGVSVNEAALQLSHFLGAGDAAKVLSAAPGTKLQGLISQSAIDKNPTILGGGRTVDDAIAYAQSRVGGGTVGAQRFDADQNFGSGLADQKLSVELLRQEIEFRRQLGPITDENRASLLAYQQAAQLLNQAQQDGSAVGRELHDVNQLLHGDLSGLSPAAREQAEAMRALALEYGNTQAAAEQLDTSQEKLQRSSEAVNDIGRDALGTLISDLREGKSAGEAFADVLDRIADRWINMVLDSLFSSGGGGGGGLGSIFGLLGKLFGFEAGGYTGAGTRKQVAGVVHAGEVVFSQADVAAHGGPAAVDAFRRSRRPFDAGGIVTPAAISAAHRTARGIIASGPMPAAAVDMRMVIDLRGANGDETIGRIAREAAAEGAQRAYQAAVATSRKSATGWVMQDRANGGGDYRL